MTDDADSLPPHLTELFYRYIDALDEGREPALEELLQTAGDEAPKLRERIDRYHALERATQGLRPASTLRPGQVFAERFTIRRSLGVGGAAQVWLAFDAKLGREVALKAIALHDAGLDERRRWLLREARSLGKVEHRNVLRVHDVFENQGALIVITEYLPGPSLAQVIRQLAVLRTGPVEEPADEREALARERAQALLPFSARARCLEDLADALANCHDRGILHRDLKPGNVVFTADGTPKLLDFGLAHFDEADGETDLDITTLMIGTAAYLAPEQVDRGATGADPKSDQFALGVVAYELLTLTQPFERKRRSQVLNAVSRAEVKPPRSLEPALPRDLERIVLHALERAPEDRFPNVAALASDLRALREHRPLSLEEPRPLRLLALWLRRHQRQVLPLAAALGLVLGVLLFGTLLSARRERQELLLELGRIGASELEMAEQYREGLERLAGLRKQAEELDASLWRRALLGGSAAEVDLGLHAMAERIRAVFDESLQPAPGPEAGAGEARAALPTLSYLSWLFVLIYEQEANGADPTLAPYRELSTVTYPAAPAGGQRALYELRQITAGEDTPDYLNLYQEVLLDRRPPPGRYRFLLWGPDGAVLAEREFEQPQGWSPKLEISLSDRGALFREAEEQPARAFDFAEYSEFPTPYRLLVPRHRLLMRLVTNAEYLAFTQATGRAVAPVPGTVAGTDPAFVPAEDAAAYCAWVGGRLPQCAELVEHLARDDFLPGAKVAAGEWVGDARFQATPDAAFWLAYASMRAAPKALVSWVHQINREHREPIGTPIVEQGGLLKWAGVSFRVAFTVDGPEALNRAGRLQSK
jgi:serine/threonine protein kinase